MDEQNFRPTVGSCIRWVAIHSLLWVLAGEDGFIRDEGHSRKI